MKVPNSPRVLLDELHDYIDSAHEVLEKGEYMELSDLNIHVQKLCQGVMALPVDEAMLYKDEMSTLMEALDDLKAHMEQHKLQLSEQIGGLETSKKAAKAYQKSSHMGTGAGPKTEGS